MIFKNTKDFIKSGSIVFFTTRDLKLETTCYFINHGGYPYKPSNRFIMAKVVTRWLGLAIKATVSTAPSQITISENMQSYGLCMWQGDLWFWYGGLDVLLTITLSCIASEILSQIKIGGEPVGNIMWDSFFCGVWLRLSHHNSGTLRADFCSSFPIAKCDCDLSHRKPNLS